MALRGGTVGSIESLKKSIKKSSGGTGAIQYVPKDGGITVRFLTEPDEWVEWFEHFDDGKSRSFGCIGEGCVYCEEDNRASKRYLAAALDVNDGNRVIALQLPVTAAASVLRKYDKYSTVMDRDYEITREGTGMDTVYDAIPEAPSKMNLRKYEIPDLEEILEANAAPDEDDEEEKTPPRRTSRTPAKKTAAKKEPARPARRRPSIIDDDEEDEEKPSGKSRTTGRTQAQRRTMAKKSLPAKKTIRRR